MAAAARQRAYLAIGWTMVLTLWAATFGYTALTLRREALASALDTARILTMNLEDQLTESLRVIELSAQGFEVSIRTGYDSPELTRRLQEAVQPAPYIRSLSLADSNGQIMASSDPLNVALVVDLDAFYPPAPSNMRLLRLGDPKPGRDWHGWMVDRIHDRRPSGLSFTPVVQPIQMDGSTYWLIASLNPEHFVADATLLLDKAVGRVNWVRYDGTLLWSTSGPGQWAHAISQAQQIGHWLDGDEHAVRDEPDDSTGGWLTAYRASSRFPAAVSVHLDRTEALANWRAETGRRALMMLPLALLLSVGAWWLWRRHRALSAQEEALAEERMLASKVFDSSTDAIFVIDAVGKVVQINPAFQRICQYTAAAILGRDARLLAPQSTPVELLEAVKTGMRQQGSWSGVMPLRRGDGMVFQAHVTLNAITDFSGDTAHYAVVLQDITDQRATEERLRLAASVFTNAQEAIMITDPKGVLIEVNDAFESITGYSREDVIGHNTSMLSSGRQDQTFYAAMWQELSRNGRWTGEIWNRKKSGEVFAELLTIGAVKDECGQVLRYVALFSDITRQKQHETHLEHIAHYDALTRLPNRVLLSDRLKQAMVQAVRRHTSLAVVFLDLDGFKAVNDSHGHATGDQLLVTLAARMKQALREGDTLARLGGDEFVAVLHDLPDHNASMPVLERLRLAASQPVHLGSTELLVSASLGIAFYPQLDDVDADQLLRQADQAMYQAKVNGKNRFHVFDAQHDRNLRQRHESLEAIRQALAESAFELFYQPKVNMRTGTVLGMEALIRWRHPERGLLGPGEFLPVVQGHALAIDLGQWVIEQALTQIEAWKRAGVSLPVSVNLDAHHLQQPDVVTWLKERLALHPLVMPGDLCLEVLETTALDDMSHAAQVMAACQAIGIGFSLDDFGTGYSSLTYLKRLPAQELKIDQSFVRDMLDDVEDLTILEGVLGLARAFQREVIAEGVETVEHGRLLLRLGCEHAQGYAIARPMPASDVLAWHARWQPDPSWQRQPTASVEDLPLLLAAAEHRAWAHQMGAYCAGHLTDFPTMDPENCRLSQWMRRSAAHSRHRETAALARVQSLHGQLHALASQFHDGTNSTALCQQAARAGAELHDALLAMSESGQSASSERSGSGRRARQPQRHLQSAILGIGQQQLPAVAQRDVLGNGQTQTDTALSLVS